jgi:hypothetical protein
MDRMLEDPINIPPQLKKALSNLVDLTCIRECRGSSEGKKDGEKDGVGYYS